MAKCKTCGKKIRIPEGWSVGPAVRRHYWVKHPEVMQKTKADNEAVASMPRKERSKSA